LLYHPEIRTNEPAQHPPYGLLELAAIVDELGFKVHLFDNNAFRFPIDAVRQGMKEEGQQDVIGFTGLTTQTKFIEKAVRVAREEFPAALIVGGGGFMSAQPFDMMRWNPEFDIGCIGEGYNTFREILEHVDDRQWSKVKGLVYREGKKVKLSPMRPLIEEYYYCESHKSKKFTFEQALTDDFKCKECGERLLNNLDEQIPWPAYEFSPVEVYLRNSPMPYSVESSGMIPLNVQEPLRRLDVRTSLGCTWHCNFCFHMGASSYCLRKIYGKEVKGPQFRQHSPRYVVQLIDDLRRRYGLNFASFIDENFTVKRKWFDCFLQKFEEAGLATLVHWGVVAHSTTVDAEMLKKARDEGLSYISYGGECLDPETYVFSASGAPIQIQYLNSTLASINFDSLQIESAHAEKTFKVQIPMLEISTRHKRLKCSPDHKLFTIKDGQICEIPANELKHGDFVAVANHIPSVQQEVFGTEQCQLLGFSIGDGYLSDRRAGFKIASSQKELLNYYGGIAKKHFLSEKALPRFYQRSKNGFELHFYSPKFKKLISSLHLDVNSPYRILHDSLLSLSESETCYLLRGLFDSDGGVGETVDQGIQYYSTSRKLVEQIKMLLLRLGVDSQNIRVKRYQKFGKTCIDYILTIKRYRDIQFFADTIGFSHPTRKTKLSVLLQAIENRRVANYRLKPRGDVIPMGVTFWKRLAKAYAGYWHGAYIRAGFGWCSYTYSKKRLESPKRETCLKLIAELEKIDCNTPELRELKTMVNANIGWQRISKIKDIGIAPIVYDFSVPAYRNYIANGFIVHNSASPRILKDIGKGQSPEQMVGAIEATQAAQVNAIMSFMVGQPSETIDSVIATCQFFIDNQVHCVPFFCSPYPGSELFAKFKDRIIMQQLTEDEKAIIDGSGDGETLKRVYRETTKQKSTVWTDLPTPDFSKAFLQKNLPSIQSFIRDNALHRWVLSLDDATKMSCNLTDEFTDVELAGLQYLLASWDITRLKKFKKTLEERKK